MLQTLGVCMSVFLISIFQVIVQLLKYFTFLQNITILIFTLKYSFDYMYVYTMCLSVLSGQTKVLDP